jgi:quinoprotein glucose dehydrogenase
MAQTPTLAKPPRTLGILLAVLGALLFVGGLWLLTRGASAYFLVVGLGLALSGMLLASGKKVGLIAYAITLAVIIAGSFLEEGMNTSKLVPRIAVPIVIGFYLTQAKVREALT